VNQTLLLYSDLVGIELEQVEDTVKTMIKKVGLADYADYKAGTLSGGNKRKLCLAMAMIG